MTYTRRSQHTRNVVFRGRHRFEHWYRDNQVYFITARCRDRRPLLAGDAAKAIFWDRFDHWTAHHTFTPFVTTLLDNHYHTIGYLRYGVDLAPLMRKLHGSVAKLVNDMLPARVVPFWHDGTRHHDYFDGCIRNEKQCRLAFRYTLMQAVYARLVGDPRDYPHTRVNVEVDRAVRRALELNALMTGVPYKRYEG